MDDHSLVKEQRLAHTRAGHRPTVRSGDMFVSPKGLPFGGGGSCAAAFVALDIREPVPAGPPDLDEAGAEPGHSGFGEEARADSKTLCHFSCCEEAVGVL